MNSTKKIARVIGLLYLIIAIVAIMSMMVIPAKLIIWDNAQATVDNITNNTGLFRLGIAGDIIVFISEIILVVLLYTFLSPVNKTLSRLASYSRFAMAILQGINILSYLFVLLLLRDSSFLTAFNTEQINGFVMMSLNIYQFIVYIWQIFFVLHLIVLGYLVIKANFLPSFLGYALVGGSLGYLLDSISVMFAVNNVAFTAINNVFFAIGIVGELGFTFYLLIKGVKQPKIE